MATDMDHNYEDYYGSAHQDGAYDSYPDLDYPELHAADVIAVYVSPLLLLLGTVGNVLSAVVMYKLSRNVLSTCLYLSALAGVDLLLLYTRCGNDWLTHLARLDLSHSIMVSSEALCRVYPFFFNFLVHLSKWLMVCVGVEGVIGTRYPRKVAVLCTVARAHVNMLLLTVLLTCINIHYFWTFRLVYVEDPMGETDGWFCTFTNHGHHHSEVFQRIIWPLLDDIVAQIIPSTLLLLCGMLMLIYISRGQHRGDIQHQSWRSRYQLHPGATDQLYVLIMLLCFVFLTLMLPNFALTTVRYFTDSADMELSLELQVQTLLAETVCAMLEHVFYSAKFLLYALTSKMFRKECRHLLCKLCRHRSRKVHTVHANATPRHAELSACKPMQHVSAVTSPNVASGCYESRRVTTVV